MSSSREDLKKRLRAWLRQEAVCPFCGARGKMTNADLLRRGLTQVVYREGGRT
ncbi:MAG: hypothetical protein JRN42_07745 [Nitrososphaerota archaeon]|nr:hypothetical protein [Nitrososphaerota archaeon]